MMEKLGEPQTHLGLKGMIKEVDEDNDGQISFREVGSNFVVMADKRMCTLLGEVFGLVRQRRPCCTSCCSSDVNTVFVCIAILML